MNACISRLQGLLNICLIFAVMWSLLGCEGSRDGKDISGDSILIVRNSTSTVLMVRFDGEYIGDINGHSRQWNVQSGHHEVKLSYGKGIAYDHVVLHDFFDFKSGEITEINYQ